MPDAPRSTGTSEALDLAVAFAASALARAVRLERGASAVARPVAAVVLHPPMLAPRYQPGTWLGRVARRGGRHRDQAVREVSAWLDRVVPVITTELLRRIDLTGVVKTYVDLDAVVAGVDLDAAVARVDVEAVVNRLDLTSIVLEDVDINAVVDTVDLNAAVENLDIDAIIERIDLAGLVQDVISEIDLPEIIRESTGSVGSETVRGVRMRGISGDDALGRAVDRLRHRRQPEPGVVTREP